MIFYHYFSLSNALHSTRSVCETQRCRKMPAFSSSVEVHTHCAWNAVRSGDETWVFTTSSRWQTERLQKIFDIILRQRYNPISTQLYSRIVNLVEFLHFKFLNLISSKIIVHTEAKIDEASHFYISYLSYFHCRLYRTTLEFSKEINKLKKRGIRATRHSSELLVSRSVESGAVIRSPFRIHATRLMSDECSERCLSAYQRWRRRNSGSCMVEAMHVDIAIKLYRDISYIKTWTEEYGGRLSFNAATYYYAQNKRTMHYMNENTRPQWERYFTPGRISMRSCFRRSAETSAVRSTELVDSM